MNPANFPQNKIRKQSEAIERNAKWASLSLSEKLNSLTIRQAGNCKQYSKLIGVETKKSEERKLEEAKEIEKKQKEERKQQEEKKLKDEKKQKIENKQKDNKQNEPKPTDHPEKQLEQSKKIEKAGKNKNKKSKH